MLLKAEVTFHLYSEFLSGEANKNGKDDGHWVQRPLRPLPKMICLQKQKKQNWKYAIFKGMGKEGMSKENKWLWFNLLILYI